MDDHRGKPTRRKFLKEISKAAALGTGVASISALGGPLASLSGVTVDRLLKFRSASAASSTRVLRFPILAKSLSPALVLALESLRSEVATQSNGEITIHYFGVEKMSGNELFSQNHSQRAEMCLSVNSSSFRSLPAVIFFGGHPAALASDKHEDWLNSDIAQTHREEFFALKDVKSILFAEKRAYGGYFSTEPITDLASLSGKRILTLSGDPSSKWYRQLGLNPVISTRVEADCKTLLSGGAEFGSWLGYGAAARRAKLMRDFYFVRNDWQAAGRTYEVQFHLPYWQTLDASTRQIVSTAVRNSGQIVREVMNSQRDANFEFLQKTMTGGVGHFPEEAITSYRDFVLSRIEDRMREAEPFAKVAREYFTFTGLRRQQPDGVKLISS